MTHSLVNSHRLTVAEAVSLYGEADLLELGWAARERSFSLHPDGVVTFLIDRNINYTNVCRNRCRFCAFYRDADSSEAFLLTAEEIDRRVGEAVAQGATQIMLQGGLHPDMDPEWFTETLKMIKSTHSIHLHSLSPPEVSYFAERASLTVREALLRLRAAGLDSLPGGGAEILVDRVRDHISPRKINSRKWLEVMETAHSLEIPTTATMMFGAGETVEERFHHLEKLRELQDRTAGFLSFIPWTLQPRNTDMEEGGETTLGYLRMLALSRLFLDNFQNIQGSWVTQGPEIGQISLDFGANDLGSIMLEENVVRAAGTAHHLTRKSMVALISAAGRVAAQRDTLFRIVENDSTR
jgi:cyclic dehypoxanthinyl futalosine synthase